MEDFKIISWDDVTNTWTLFVATWSITANLIFTINVQSFITDGNQWIRPIMCYGLVDCYYMSIHNKIVSRIKVYISWRTILWILVNRMVVRQSFMDLFDIYIFQYDCSSPKQVDDLVIAYVYCILGIVYVRRYSQNLGSLQIFFYQAYIRNCLHKKIFLKFGKLTNIF